MSNKKTSLQQVSTTLKYNSSFEIDLNRFSIVVDQMIHIYKKCENIYKKTLLFPEFVFKEYFHKEEHKEHLSQILFLSAYFDHNKKSQEHYLRDMKRFDDFIKQGTLEEYITRCASQEVNKLLEKKLFYNSRNIKKKLNDPILHYAKNIPQDNLIAQLYKLSPLHQTYFMKKVARTIALDPIKYLEKINKEDLKNNKLEDFRSALNILVEEYDANPLNIVKDKTPQEFSTALQEIKGIGPGLAYLTVLFYAHAGLTPYSVHELEGVQPKVDGNDIHVAQLTNILTVHKETNKTAIINGLMDAMELTAKDLNITTVDVDLCFWIASQGYRTNLAPQYNTATPFFSKEEFYAHPTNYYSKGIILPNTEGKKVRQDIKNNSQLKLF